MMRDKHSVTYLGATNGRPPAKRFGIKQADRLSHLYVIGKTGVGKSSLLENMLRQDVLAGRGFALLDPHGDLAARIAAFAQLHAPEHLVYLNAPDPTCPYGYNPLRTVSKDRIPLAASGLLETLKKRFSDAWGVRMHCLNDFDPTYEPDVTCVARSSSYSRPRYSSFSIFPARVP